MLTRPADVPSAVWFSRSRQSRKRIAARLAATLALFSAAQRPAVAAFLGAVARHPAQNRAQRRAAARDWARLQAKYPGATLAEILRFERDARLERDAADVSTQKAA